MFLGHGLAVEVLEGGVPGTGGCYGGGEGGYVVEGVAYACGAVAHADGGDGEGVVAADVANAGIYACTVVIELKGSVRWWCE